MAINIFAGRPNACIALETISFASAGITGGNTAIIYQIDEEIESYVPGREVNPITGFIEGKGYYLVALTDIDLGEIVLAGTETLITTTTSSTTTSSTTVFSGSSEEIIVWDQLQNVVVDSPDIRESGSVPAGATATKKLLKADGNYLQMDIEYLDGTNSNAALCIDGDNDADYVWLNVPVGLYITNLDDLTSSINGVNTEVYAGSNNYKIRMEISGNDILVKVSYPDMAGEYGLAGTLSGVLTGLTNLYIKAIFTNPTSTRRLSDVRAKGLIAI